MIEAVLTVERREQREEAAQEAGQRRRSTIRGVRWRS